MKRTIATDDAPAAVGAYSQATTNGDVLITAGQLPLTVDGDLLTARGPPSSAAAAATLLERL